MRLVRKKTERGPLCSQNAFVPAKNQKGAENQITSIEETSEKSHIVPKKFCYICEHKKNWV